MKRAGPRWLSSSSPITRNTNAKSIGAGALLGVSVRMKLPCSGRTKTRPRLYLYWLDLTNSIRGQATPALNNGREKISTTTLDKLSAKRPHRRGPADAASCASVIPVLSRAMTTGGSFETKGQLRVLAEACFHRDERLTIGRRHGPKRGVEQGVDTNRCTIGWFRNQKLTPPLSSTTLTSRGFSPDGLTGGMGSLTPTHHDMLPK